MSNAVCVIHSASMELVRKIRDDRAIPSDAPVLMMTSEDGMRLGIRACLGSRVSYNPENEHLTMKAIAGEGLEIPVVFDLSEPRMFTARFFSKDLDFIRTRGEERSSPRSVGLIA